MPRLSVNAPPASAGNAGILVLAAGRSRRFGSDKRLAHMPHSGRTLLESTISAARDSGLPVRVCLREGDDDLAATLSGDGVATIICRHASHGMGATLAEAVAADNDWDVMLVALADMPLVRAATYLRLAQACSRDGLAVPRYRGRRGNPVGFGAAWFGQLARCDGDRGARHVLAANSQAIVPVDVDDPGILRDVDWPADLEAMR